MGSFKPFKLITAFLTLGAGTFLPLVLVNAPPANSSSDGNLEEKIRQLSSNEFKGKDFSTNNSLLSDSKCRLLYEYNHLLVCANLKDNSGSKPTLHYLSFETEPQLKLKEISKLKYLPAQKKLKLFFSSTTREEKSLEISSFPENFTLFDSTPLIIKEECVVEKDSAGVISQLICQQREKGSLNWMKLNFSATIPS